MPAYEIHIQCIYCNGEHPLLMKIHLDEGPSHKQSLAEAFLENAMPPQLLAVRRHSALCLKTGKKFKIESDEQILLVPTSF